MQSVTIENDKVVITVTDEVEAVGGLKVRKVLTFLYAELCYKKAFKKFHCEGCEKDWPSQRDHECCLKSGQEIFDEFYDDVKDSISLESLNNFCKMFSKLVNIPMTPEWGDFIQSLPNRSSYSIYAIWEDMTNSCENMDMVIVDFVEMLCNSIDNENAWSTNTHLKFESFMKYD